jgi:alpha,alpha-trehalase
MTKRSHRGYGFLGILLSLWLGVANLTAQSKERAAQQGLSPILTYISSAWDTLTRSMTNCETIVDPKLVEASVLYLPAESPVSPKIQELEKRCKVRVQHLPLPITGPGQIDPNKLTPPGLLYLENNYVVPGGRFNEMYGWDSYFIVRGLLEDRRIDLARGMVENFFFEIEHYGTVLNANRTYYLTRSQPPFLTSMILAVYDAQKSAGHEDRAWLERAYGYAAKDYELWNREPHLAGSTGLSRYYDFGEGPAPESLKDETGVHRKVASYFLFHPDPLHGYVVADATPEAAVGFHFSAQVCEKNNSSANSPCEPGKDISLSRDYYKGDRSMRESGFDISFRFGPYGAATHHYAPVCLNSLLYKSEKDMQKISDLLGRKEEAQKWADRAQQRKQRIQQYLWDAQREIYFDYNLESNTRSTYEYITTLYPLWAGLATPEQARAVVRNLAIFEHPGGLAMSNKESKGQWDLPYGWAPTQMIAIEGLRRFGFNDDANRVSYEFLSTIAENFRREGTIREKYDVVTRSSESQVEAGYRQNVIGFGWTNAAFLVLLHELPKDWADRLAKE